jgi:hypothetical protein
MMHIPMMAQVTKGQSVNEKQKQSLVNHSTERIID